MSRLLIRRSARADVRSIRGGYEEERQGLGREFVVELDQVVERIRRTPKQFPEVRPGVRRALLQRFPHSVYFVLRTDGRIVIAAVLHQHRSPTTWRKRAGIEDAG